MKKISFCAALVLASFFSAYAALAEGSGVFKDDATGLMITLPAGWTKLPEQGTGEPTKAEIWRRTGPGEREEPQLVVMSNTLPNGKKTAKEFADMMLEGLSRVPNIKTLEQPHDVQFNGVSLVRYSTEYLAKMRPKSGGPLMVKEIANIYVHEDKVVIVSFLGETVHLDAAAAEVQACLNSLRT